MNIFYRLDLALESIGIKLPVPFWFRKLLLYIFRTFHMIPSGEPTRSGIELDRAIYLAIQLGRKTRIVLEMLSSSRWYLAATYEKLFCLVVFTGIILCALLRAALSEKNNREPHVATPIKPRGK
jgi:hypothetical protein